MIEEFVVYKKLLCVCGYLAMKEVTGQFSRDDHLSFLKKCENFTAHAVIKGCSILGNVHC